MFDRFDTPICTLMIAADSIGLRHIEFERNRYPASRAGWRACLDVPANMQADARATLRITRAQLLEYFAGERRHFDLPLQPQGTVFQCRVWSMLATIPYGKTWSYRDLAQAIDKPEAVRAVGAANGRNPLPIVLPCHRVIGADGALVGFGGGLPIKTALLQLEGALPGALPATGDLFA